MTPKTLPTTTDELLSAGYRILAPGEVDRETVERCAEMVEHPKHIYGHSRANTADAIRTLTDGDHDA